MKLPAFFTKKTLVWAFAALLSGAVFFSCEEPQPVEPDEKEEEEVLPPAPSDTTETEKPDTTVVPKLAVVLKEAAIVNAVVTVNSEAVESVAYIVSTEARDNMSQTIIYATGTEVEITEASQDITLEGLESATTHYLYVAGKLNAEEFYSEVQCLEITTQDYDFEELLTLVETYHDGYKVHVSVPQEVLDRGNAIRYTFGNVAMYYTSLYGYGTPDFDQIITNGGQPSIQRDTTITLNNDNVERHDENGNIVYDDYGDPAYIHDPIVPGEPIVFLAGEFEWGEAWYGWGNGYYIPYYDFAAYDAAHGGNYGGFSSPMSTKSGGYADMSEIQLDMDTSDDQFWKGPFQRLVFRAKLPEELENAMNVEIVSASCIDASILIEPNDEISQYAVGIMDNGTYNKLVNTMLWGNEDWVQWFSTSMIGFMEGFQTRSGDVLIKSLYSGEGAFFYEPLAAETLYHVIVTGMNEDASKQCFVHKTFETTAKVKEAPVINVTAKQATPFEAVFNIQAPNADLVSARYACDYARVWELSFLGEYPETYASIAAQGYALSAAEIAKINSPAGLDVYFPSIDGETTRLAVLGYNDEFTPNVLEKGCSAIADCTTPLQDLEPVVSTTLFDDLVGDWTATATIRMRTVDDDNNEVEYNKKWTSKIEISQGIEYSERMPDDFRDVYESLGLGDAAQGYYDEYIKLAEQFNKYRTKYRNRLLCQGWIDWDRFELSRLTTMTPYELMTRPDYQSIDVAQVFYDFGPKWFLDVEAGDVVTVPFDGTYLPPMLAWVGYPYYLAAYNYETNNGYISPVTVANGQSFGLTTQANGSEVATGFPVEISNDKNTIRIKPVYDGAVPYYPNAIGVNQGRTELSVPIISEIVLTRGWTEPAATQHYGSPLNYNCYLYAPDGTKVSGEVAVYKSMTGIKPSKKVETVPMKLITPETIDEGMRKYVERKTR